ncbi:MAG: two-component system, NarL family, sensor kinase [Actinomycetota bacterium]|jgi:two-component system NarL family sensor kinase|nr:two-component system, NarL family, sensor kinase [Actinomycetota bacterium]
MARRQSRPSSVSAAVAGFLLAGLVVVVIIGVFLAVAQRRTAVSEAIRDARTLTALEAQDVIGPLLTDGALVPGPAQDALDRTVRERVLGSRIVRVKIWDSTGRIVYSDDRALIGQRFDLPPGELAALQSSTRTVAEVTNLDEPENRDERHFGKLLQVYLGVRTPSGRPLLFETYQPYGVITTASRRMWSAALPVLLGGLVLLYLVQAPLAYRMATRLRAAQEQREQLLLSSLGASEQERRRIASDLHDGVVQGLAGASYTLSAVAEKARASGGAQLADTAAHTAVELRRWVRELRSLVVTITPPALQEHGLAASLSDLASTLESRGISVHVEVPPDIDLDEATESLVYRVAQEGVRNVVRHAEATRVQLCLRHEPSHLQLEVTDDGRGIDLSATGARRRGSVGLELLQALVAEHDGTLVVGPAAGGGTTLMMEMPYREVTA